MALMVLSEVITFQLSIEILKKCFNFTLVGWMCAGLFRGFHFHRADLRAEMLPKKWAGLILEGRFTKFPLENKTTLKLSVCILL